MSVLRWALQRQPGVEGPGSDRAAQYGVGAGGQLGRDHAQVARSVMYKASEATQRKMIGCHVHEFPAAAVTK